MIVNKILKDGSFQPDLSGLENIKIMSYSLNEDGETYTLVVVNTDKKREAYDQRLGHLVQQIVRLEAIGETERIPSLKAEIAEITAEIRNEFK